MDISKKVEEIMTLMALATIAEAICSTDTATVKKKRRKEINKEKKNKAFLDTFRYGM